MTGGNVDSREEKRAIRVRMQALRAALPIDDYRRRSMAIYDTCRALDEFIRARTVHIYVSSVNNEVDTMGLLYTLFDRGARVVVPRCQEKGCLMNIHIDSFHDLKPAARFGIMEPPDDPSRAVDPGEFDLVIVPLLAFDRTGGRLGFGGGYYDRLLAQCSCPRVGLGFAFQEMPLVPREAHDIPLDLVVTDTAVLRMAHD